MRLSEEKGTTLAGNSEADQVFQLLLYSLWNKKVEETSQATKVEKDKGEGESRDILPTG